ncbi:glycoside hydrolase family 16 protein [Fibrella forsythiae]|uniref:Glycoside hydrolase family 16 protein n=1 Tax=Fibrella forsythiae TaxID=2817061 RepID=A0ABS3JIQ2_9BACT|nr:glycoside hydrolase family 16 protein [Fibrella forsythiae]MBO0949865.1 glycoside hydrolase family 16 protein [Fibrella forsythiae]
MRSNQLRISLITLLLSGTFLINSCKTSSEPCAEKTWYLDADKDGKGNPNKTYLACDQPIGYVSNSSDDNDDPAPVSIIPTKGYTTPTTYSGLKLVWADEFTGTALNETYWNYELGDGCPNNCGWGNNELEYYKKENTSVKDGYLIIQAKSEAVGSKAYTSSRLTTQGKVNMKYGRVDIRAAMPKGQGIWPALWMLGKNINTVGWPKCGEIDILEMIGGGATGRDDTAYGTAHWDNNNSHAQYGGSTKVTSGVLGDEFHVFSIIWDAQKITWYLDDKPFHVIDTTPSGLSEFQEEYFFIFNLAVGGDWPGKPDGTTVLPQHLIVDYIRVFQ